MKTETPDNLKRCPFCGSKAHIEHHTYPMVKTRGKSKVGHLLFVKCNRCSASYGASSSRQEAIKDWNRRTSEELVLKGALEEVKRRLLKLHTSGFGELRECGENEMRARCCVVVNELLREMGMG